jgi:hypothetical protein
LSAAIITASHSTESIVCRSSKHHPIPCRDSWNEASGDIFLFIVNNYLRQSSCRTALESQLKSIKLKLWGFRLIWSNQTVRFTTNTTILMITSFI